MHGRNRAAGLSSPASAPRAEPDPAAERRAELAHLQDEIKLSDEVVSPAAGRDQGDRRRPHQAARPISSHTAARTREPETKIIAAELRLSELSGKEGDLKASLASAAACSSR